jgi:hypothetical protein
VLAVGVLVMLGVFLVLVDPLRLFAARFSGFAAQDVGVVASTDANPHVVGQLRRGEPINGHWTDRRADRARWLEVNWPGAGKAYIWGHALSADPRPQLVSIINSSGVAASGSQVFARPEASAPVVDNLSPGESVAIIGPVPGNWTEIALPVGGVGYVPSTILDGPVDLQTNLAGVTHFVCSLSAPDSVNPPPETPGLSFVLDANRSCIDHRYPYARGDGGELRRVMFDPGKHRATLLMFSSDRQTFERSDFSLDAKSYENLSAHGNELASLECAVPADSAAATKLSKAMTRMMPELGPQTPAVSSSRRVWRCVAP